MKSKHSAEATFYIDLLSNFLLFMNL